MSDTPNAVEPLIESLLKELGEDPGREGLVHTPHRVAEAFRFFTEGYGQDPQKILNNALFDVDYDEMVIVKDIDFHSLCEHHLLPFFGRAHVAYIPNGKVVGLSNTLLLSAGYAPVFPERPLDDPGMTMARQAVDRLLKGHEPHPALVVDRRWNLIAANSAVSRLLVGIDPSLLAAPANVLRLSLHPEGLASRIGNFREWRGHIIGRLMRQIENSADPELAVLMEEIRSYPVPANARPHRPGRTDSLANIAVPFELATDFGTLSFLSTTTIFGTALDISLSEMTIESFYPADPLTADSMRRLMAANAE